MLVAEPGCALLFFSVRAVSSATGGNVVRLVGGSLVDGWFVEDESAEVRRGRAVAGYDMIDDAIFPVAARKPSGRVDRSKVSETFLKRPLSDDEAAWRFGTEGEVSSTQVAGSFWAGAESIEGKGSMSLLEGEAGIMSVNRSDSSGEFF